MDMTAPRAPFTDPAASIRAASTPVAVERCGSCDYVEMWHRQAELADKRARGEIGDVLLMLEHPSTYTAGKRTQSSDRPTNGLPCVDVDRGGRITWHGPGQLVGYPIVQLATPVDVVDYVRRLEEALIHTVRECGVAGAGRIDGRSGVWVPADDRGPDRKVAALGIRVTRGVTMHGFALNCNNTLEYYRHIVPCGISDAGVTTLSQELGTDISPDDVTAACEHWVIEALDGRLTVADHSFGSAEDPCSPQAIRRMGAATGVG